MGQSVQVPKALTLLTESSWPYCLLGEKGHLYWANAAFWQFCHQLWPHGELPSEVELAALSFTGDAASQQRWQQNLAAGKPFEQKIGLKLSRSDAPTQCLWVEADPILAGGLASMPKPGYLLRCKEKPQTDDHAPHAARQVEAALRDTEAILRTAGEMANLGGWAYDVATARMLWTDYAYLLCEWDPETKAPNLERFIALVQGESRQQLIEVLKLALTQGKPYDLELAFLSPQGSLRIIRMMCQPLIEGGEVLRLIGGMQDITEQKATQRALYKQADLLNQTQRIAKLGGWELDVGTGLTTWTEEVYRIHEVEPSFDHNLPNGLDFYPDEEKPRIQRAIEEACSEQKAFDLECRFITAKGNHRWVRVLGSPLVKAGQVVQINGFFQDITAPKEAELALREREERLHRITHNVPGVIYEFQIDANGKQTFPFLSEGIAEIFPGLEPEQLQQDATLSYASIHPDDAARIQAQGEHSMKRLADNHVEFRVMHEGEVYWRQSIAKPERKPDGSTIWYGLFRDITTEKRTQEALKRTTDHLQNAQRMARIGSYEVDLTQRIMHLSESFREIFGLSPMAYYPLDEYLSMIHPEDRALAISLYQDAQKNGSDFNLEYRLNCPDGNLRHVNSWGYCILDDEGTVIGVVGTKQDITERKQAEMALAENEEKLRLLTENMREAFWLRNADNTEVKYISPAYEQVWGMSSERLCQAPNSFLEAIHPEDQPMVIEAATAYPETLVYDLEHRLLHPDGTVRWVWVRQTPVYDDDGSVVAHAGVAADITDRKLSEERLRLFESVVEHGNDAVVITSTDPLQGDLSGPPIIYANAAFCRMSGYSPADIQGQTPGILQGPNTDPKELARIATALQNWETVEAELINYHKDGSEYWTSVVISPISDGKGGHSHWVSIQRDTSRRKKEELELIAAKEQAELASQAKSEFLSTMSHEIRTPLNAIIGMTGLLAETELDDEQHSFLRTIRQGGESLLSVINDILDYSKIEAGQMELEVEAFDLLDPIEDTLELLADKAHRKHLELLYHAQEPLFTQVKGDVTRLRQILVNLVGNAIKFTEQGEVLVEVEQIAATEGRAVVQFSVKDTGIGIPADKMDRLFKSFSQVDASTTRQFGGTGLGLAISQKLVELHGGRIWVESELGKGSTFCFTLAVEPDAHASPLVAPRLSLHGKQVWLVDDNQTNLLIQEKLLTKQGAKVCCFEEPEQFQTHWAHNPAPDAVILDFHMPRQDGATLAKWIRTHDAHIPLMLLSSGQSAQQFRPYFDLVIQKPMRNREYLAAVERLIHRENSRQPIHEEAKPEEVDFSEFKILLVEDNKVNQRVAQRMLHKFGAKVETANNGQEAVDFARLRPFDLVLMDMQMPVMDGLEATSLIRGLDDHPQPKILAMTANASKEDRARCLAVGMDDFIAKPIKLAELRNHLRRWLVDLAE